MSEEKLATGFYLVAKHIGQNDLLPVKTTQYSAGYDFKAAEDIEVPVFKSGVKPVMVPTGVKCKLAPNQVLLCFNRSSNPLKRGLVIANGVGVVDADYFDNSSNEGEIAGIFWNFGSEPYQIHQGDRIMQGVVVDYQNLAKAMVKGALRSGGFGSTDEKR